VLPLARPALATLTIFTLLGAWNDLGWPLIAINDEDAYTIQRGLADFQGTRRTRWSLLMSGNVVATMTFSGLKG
jgi:multiple sugar transport system permease protein